MDDPTERLFSGSVSFPVDLRPVESDNMVSGDPHATPVEQANKLGGTIGGTGEGKTDVLKIAPLEIGDAIAFVGEDASRETAAVESNAVDDDGFVLEHLIVEVPRHVRPLS